MSFTLQPMFIYIIIYDATINLILFYIGFF